MTAASTYLDEAWKRQAVIRSGSTSRASASVRYTDLRTWSQLRSALSESALVSEFQVNAISRDGALVTFKYAGDDDRLIGELRQRGVLLKRSGSGWVMESASGGRS